MPTQLVIVAVALGPFFVVGILYHVLLEWYSRGHGEQAPPPNTMTWSTQEAFLDEELQNANLAQVTELSSYRTEALQLVGFAGVIASVTAALNTREHWALVTVVAIFAALLLIDTLAVSGPRATASSFDPSDTWTQAKKRERMRKGSAFTLPSLEDLHRDAFAARLEAFGANQRRIRRRRLLLVVIRVGLLAAVVISVASAFKGGSVVRDDPTPVPSKPHPHIATTTRHHHPKRSHRCVRLGLRQGRACLRG